MNAVELRYAASGNKYNVTQQVLVLKGVPATIYSMHAKVENST